MHYFHISQKENYLKDSKNLNIERYENFEPTSKDLKLLSSFSAIEWSRTWIYEMLHVPDYFPTFMFQDMFKNYNITFICFYKQALFHDYKTYNRDIIF